MTLKKLTKYSSLMLWANFIAVYLIACEFLFISQYVSKNQLNYQLITKLDQIPQSPNIVFWQCIASTLILITIITIRHNIDLPRRINNLFILLEFISALTIYFAVRMNYNGIFLLVFVDFFLTNEDLPSIFHYHYWIIVGIALVMIFSISSYSFLGNIFHMPSLDTYIDCLPNKTSTLVNFLNSFFSAFNLILFIWISLEYSLLISQREQRIKSKLSTMSKSNRELKNYAALSEKIAQDRERKRIARDIHDTVGHALTGIAAGIDAVMVLIDINPEAAKKQLKKVSVAVKQGLVDIRKTLNKIRPDALENYTLEASLKKMIKEYRDLSHLKIDFTYNWGEVDFEKTTELVIFRVIEESVTNALRHGHATRVKIDCALTSNSYKIAISNNGETIHKVKPGYGLTQMKERLAVINGKLKITSEPIFTITINIPRKEENHD